MEENIKKVIIIPNNNKLPIFERCCLEHKICLMEYINDCQIYIKPINYYSVDSIELSFELSKLNSIILLYDEYKGNKEIVVIIPDYVTKTQINYINNIKDILETSNLMLYLKNDNNIWIPIDKTNVKDNIINILITELNNRKQNPKQKQLINQD